MMCFPPFLPFWQLFSAFNPLNPMPADQNPRNQQHQRRRHKKHRHRSFAYARAILIGRGFQFPPHFKLGKGRYSKAYKVLDNVGRQFAVKITDFESVSESFQLKFVPRELTIWRQLDHPNIVRLHKDFKKRDYLFEIIDLADGGDLLKYLHANGPVEQMQCRGWMLQLLNGLTYLHRKRIVHRDLKPENVLLFEDGSIKISDFGFAKQCGADMSSTFCGTKEYKAPEVLQRIDYDPFKSDVWSFGVICFVMLTNRQPYKKEMTKSQMVEQQRTRQYRYPSRVDISDECRRTIDTIFTFDPEERPNIFEVGDLPWFASDAFNGEGSSASGSSSSS